ncbi:hypothetical protein GGF50DRAFT_62115 [Schizophyllum commune]
MGILGLTTFLRENKRTLLKQTRVNGSAATVLVVDGWSFIYYLYQSTHAAWVYGGEYEDFYTSITSVVKAWLQVGFKLHFVFDGPSPDSLKFPTQVGRLNHSNVEPSSLFFRTSPISRSQPRFLNESRILPPLAFQACIRALLDVENADLRIHYADGEGDPFAVELAGRLGGYVCGNDSDFVVLNADGYRGYIPFDEMVWDAPDLYEDPPAEDDGFFQPVRKGKNKRKPVKAAVAGPLPPEGVPTPPMTISYYSPQSLADLLGVPVTLLPLVGALVGNDFTKQTNNPMYNRQLLFFEKHATPTQRFNTACTAIRSILVPSAQRRHGPPVDGIMSLIERTVNALLSRVGTLGSGEVAAVVDNIVEATLPYAMPKPLSGSLWPSPVCALHAPETCTILPMFSRLFDFEAEASFDERTHALRIADKARRRYIKAYRAGALSHRLADVLSTGTFWPRVFLENPDAETVSKTVGRHLRQLAYAVLHESLGLPVPPEEEDDEEEAEEEEDDDDAIVDVVESDSDAETIESVDPLAPLEGALRRIRRTQGPPTSSAASTMSSVPSRPSVRPCTVTEYVRRGTHVSPEPVVVPTMEQVWASLSVPAPTTPGPLALQPLEVRMQVFLRSMHSDVASVRQLQAHELLPVLALRWVVRVMHDRAQGSGNREREKERWSRREARCFLAAFSWPAHSSQDKDQTEPEQTQQQQPPHDDSPDIDNRNVQLTAQVLAAMEAVSLWAQSLLLWEHVPLPAHLFSGRRFHRLLTAAVDVEPGVPEHLWLASIEGQENFLGEEVKRKTKKGTTGVKTSQPNARSPKSVKGRAQGADLFRMLETIEGDIE